MNKHRILFLAADPLELPERRLDEQARQIMDEIRRERERDRFEFIACPAARPMDLLRELRRVNPSIVHFSGHQGVDGIYLSDDNRRRARVSREALHATLGAAGESVQIVVLNGCTTHDVGEALREIVPVCVGTPTSTSDDAARAFSVGFYGALAASQSVAGARRQGEAAMWLEVGSQHDRTCLYHRRDVDPGTFVLTERVASLGYLAKFDRSSLQKSIARYTVALQADPADRDALLSIGGCYLNLGFYDLADRYVRQLIDAHPAEPYGYYYRAICLFKGKRPRTASLPVIREAEQLIHMALELDPTNGCYDVLLAAIRHDYYVRNGLRVPAPLPEQLMASAGAKSVELPEAEQIFSLLKVDDGPMKRWFLA